MPVPGDINLLKAKTVLTPELLALMERLRIVSYISIVVVLLVGLVVGAIFLFLTNERTSIAQAKQQVLAVLSTQARKEGLFFSIKDRIPLTDRVLQNEKPWGGVLDMAGAIVLPPKLSSIAVDDHYVVTLSGKTGSVDEVAGWTNSLLDLVTQKRIRSPQLVALQLTEEGNILVSLSFIPN